MTIAVANTSNTSTFAYWITRTNEIAHALSNKVITVDSNTTTGNAIVNGAFQANSLTTTNATVGNDSVNVAITSTTISFSGVPMPSITPVNTNIVASTGVVDSFVKSTYRGVEYVVTVKNNDANAYQISKLNVLHDGSTTDAYVSEYGVVISNGQLGVFTANSNATHTKLYFNLSGSVSNVQIKAVRIPVPV